MTLPWPWPDDRLERAHRIAHFYRAIARDADRPAVDQMDAAMRNFGQTWIVDGFTVDPDHLVTIRELAEIAGASPAAVRKWVARWPLTCRGHDDDGHQLYRWGDVLDRQRAARQR